MLRFPPCPNRRIANFFDDATTSSKELVKPIESRVWHAELVADVLAHHRISASRDNAIDIVQPDRSIPTAVLELKPQDRSSSHWAWIRVGGWGGAFVLGDTGLEPNCLEIKHRDVVDIEVVAAEKLDGGEVAEYQVGRCDPRVRCIDDICRSVLGQVERGVLAIQSSCGKRVELGPAQASARCARVELCHIVKDGESSSGAGRRSCTTGGACVVLNAMTDSNLLEGGSHRRRGKW